jgi:hypothetical protein
MVTGCQGDDGDCGVDGFAYSHCLLFLDLFRRRRAEFMDDCSFRVLQDRIASDDSAVLSGNLDREIHGAAVDLIGDGAG